MANELMRYLRERNSYSYKKMAKFLGVTKEEYNAIKSGNTLTRISQTEKLGHLYGIDYRYILRESLNTDLLITREAVIKVLKIKIPA